MCGIAGFLELERRPGTQELEAIAAAMAARLAHRGPDARGVFVDADAGIAFGHTRLSIIDLSRAGAQPMSSSCGRYVITYNGEVYSAAELRPELEALGRVLFASHCLYSLLDPYSRKALSRGSDSRSRARFAAALLAMMSSG